MLYKNYKVTNKQILTRKRELVSEVIAENEEAAKSVVAKEIRENLGRTYTPYDNNSRGENIGTLVSIEEDVIIEEIK